MSDLISRSALIEAMEKKYEVAEKKAFYSVGLSEGFIVTEEIIKEQPAVDAVPVEVIQKLENPYSPIDYQDAFAGFETAKCQLLLKYGNKVQDDGIKTNSKDV